MKTNAASWIVGVLAGILASECHANLSGSDDFNNNSKDPARWGIDSFAGVGLFAETNGRLEFTTSDAPTSIDLAARPWILNFGSYTQNWEIQMDVNVPQLADLESHFGLLIEPGTVSFNNSNSFRVDLAQSANDRRFAANVQVNGAGAGVGYETTTSTFAALRIAFDANTKVISAFYDEDGPTCGYSWTFLGSTDVPAAWNMTSAEAFGAWVFGFSQFASVASTNNLFGDNFHASSGSTPNLAINFAGGKVALAWRTNAPPCQLEFASTLTPPICWHAVATAPGIFNTNFTVTNTVSSDKGFYRLSR